MKIIILGAGRMGESVAEHLVSERNDITVIDQNPGLLAKLQQRFDLRGIVGNGALPSVLEDAGATDADLLLACSGDDAINLTASKAAQLLFNIPRRIVRLRSDEWMTCDQRLIGDEGFAVSQIISPEISVRRYIQKLVEYPEALQVREFTRGLAALVSVRATPGAPMTGKAIREYAQHMPGAALHVAALYRRFADSADRFVPCDGDARILAGDEVFFLTAQPLVRDALASVHADVPPVQRLLIAGCGNVGLQVAKALQHQVQIKIIESSQTRCEYLASALDSSVLVLHGDATDEELLADENIEEVDFFCALTNDDENNIMAGLLAKQLGATRVLSLVNRRSYADLVHGTQVDIALSPAQPVMGELLAHIRQGDVRAVHSVRRGAAEALELVARGNRLTSRVVGRKVGDIDLPPNAHIGLVVRGLRDSADEGDEDDADAPETAQVLPAEADTVIQRGDHVIVFLPHRRHIAAVEKLFRVSPLFL